MESWSSATRGDDRTRFASHPANTQQVTESWSSRREPEDRTPCKKATTSTSRIAESWSNARERTDRTRLATVDIRQGSYGAESWSNTQERDDRTRSVGAGRRRSLTTTQVRIAAAAAFAVLGFVVFAQVANAEDTTNGTNSSQSVVTSPSTTETNSGAESPIPLLPPVISTTFPFSPSSTPFSS